MRTPMNMISPLILLWSMIYVLALLSLYTYIAGFLARSRDAGKAPRKTNQKQLRIQPAITTSGMVQLTVVPTN
jgi:hypothetical protein